MNLINKNGEKLRFNSIGKNKGKYVAYYFSSDENHQLSFNVKFLGINDSTRKGKRYVASFQIGTDKNTELKEPVIKHVHFGSSLHDNYTIHKDEDRKKRYKIRHKNDNLENPLSPGALSMFILWEKTSLGEGIKFYKKHFKI